MEEFNEQEQIKNPNQLDLFEGMLLTPKQEQMVKDYIERNKKTVDLVETKNKQCVDLLYTNGFSFKEFTNTFKRETVTREVTLGYDWDGTKFTTEITHDIISGGISLIGLRHDSGEIKETTYWIDFNKDKIQCNSICDHHRYIKPKTLLEKLREHNAKQMYLCDSYNKKHRIKNYTIEKYQKLYPNATVEHTSAYTRASGTIELIQVKFPSGSYVQFYIPSQIDLESVYKKFDAEVEKLSIGEVLEKFNKQEGSK